MLKRGAGGWEQASPKERALGCPPRATRAPRRAHRLVGWGSLARQNDFGHTELWQNSVFRNENVLPVKIEIRPCIEHATPLAAAAHARPAVHEQHARRVRVADDAAGCVAGGARARPAGQQPRGALSRANVGLPARGDAGSAGGSFVPRRAAETQPRCPAPPLASTRRARALTRSFAPSLPSARLPNLPRPPPAPLRHRQGRAQRPHAPQRRGA